MGMIFILIGEAMHLTEGMIVRNRSKKHCEGGLVFNALSSFFSMLVFILTDKNGISIPRELWLYGILSGILFAGGFYYMFLALQCGSFAMTRMVSSFAIVLPIFYGIFFLRESIDAVKLIGILLIFAAVALTQYGKTDKSERKFSSNRWLRYTILSLLCNGGINIVSRMQQIHFDNSCTNEFFIISLACSFLFLTSLGIFKSRGNTPQLLKKNFLYSLIIGITTAINDLVTVFTYLYIPISLATPIRTGLCLAISFTVSVLLYKEKFTKIQLMGALLGLVALLLLK